MSSPGSDGYWSDWSDSDLDEAGAAPMPLGLDNPSLLWPAYFVPRDAEPRYTGHTAEKVLDFVGERDHVTKSLLGGQLEELWLRSQGAGDPLLHDVEVRAIFYSHLRAEPGDGDVVYLHCELDDLTLADLTADQAPAGLWSLLQNLD